jgi:large subunit ribosomal protein L5
MAKNPTDETNEAKAAKPAKEAKAPKEPKAAKEGKEPKAAKEGKAAEGKGAKEPKPKEGKEKAPKEPAEKPVPPRLQIKYEKEILPALTQKLGRKNRHSLPRLQKIVINMGVGAATQDKKHLEAAADAMTQIAGQKPVLTKARQAISAFKLREGMPIGCAVTLRKQRMYEFLDRLVSLALPRVRDFRGINRKAFDGHGNYSLGLSEQLVFPELNPDKFPRIQGMNITFVVANASDDESRELLAQLGMPFQAETTGKGKQGN